MTQSEATPQSNRRQMWLLVGLFFAPLAIAFILYYGVEGWRPHGSTNNGDLIEPRPLPKVALSNRARFDSGRGFPARQMDTPVRR